MPISGLVLQFHRQSESIDETVQTLHAHPSIDVGVRSDSHLAIVLDTPDADTDHRMMTWLESLPAVESVRITFIGFDESETA